MRSGPVLDFVVGLALEYPGDIPGDGRTWFAFCRAELIRSGPLRCGPVVHRVARYVFSYPDGIPGDGQTWFVVVRSYSVSSGLAVGGVKLG